MNMPETASGMTRNTVDIGNGVQIYYEEKGSGQPVLFVHGLWGTCRYFYHQLGWFGERYRAIALDLRGHGRSSMTLSGQTVPTYAKDLLTFMDTLGLQDVVLVGWSMGSFVIWDYYQQFGAENIKGMVDIDQAPTDFKFDDFPVGLITFDMLRQWVAETQTNRNELAKDIVRMWFKNPLSDEEFEWMYHETTRAPEVVAGTILFDQSVRDYRPVIEGFSIPTLICFGADETLQSLEAARWMEGVMKQAKLEVFEQSRHCPMLEEPERFNKVVDAFIRSLK